MWRNQNVLFNIYHIGAIHCISVLLYILLMEWFQILSPQNCPGGPPAWGVGDEVYSRRCPVLCRPQHKDHNIPGPAGRPGQRVRTLILKTNRALATLNIFIAYRYNIAKGEDFSVYNNVKEGSNICILQKSSKSDLGLQIKPSWISIDKVSFMKVE